MRNALKYVKDILPDTLDYEYAEKTRKEFGQLEGDEKNRF